MITQTTLDRGIRAIFANSEFALLHAGVEETDPGYRRQPAVWDAPGDGSLVNAADIWFPAFHSRLPPLSMAGRSTTARSCSPRAP